MRSNGMYGDAYDLGLKAGNGGNGSPPSGPDGGQEGLTLRDYLDVLWRRKWIIILVVVVATASAYFFSVRQAKVYEASADLIYERQLDLSNPLTGQSYTDVNERAAQLASVGSIIASPDMQDRAGALLAGQGEASGDVEVDAEPVTDDSAGAGSTVTTVVRITATSGRPRMAAAAANAYAIAFVDYRREVTKEQIQRGIDAINTKMDTYPQAAKDSTDYLVLQQRLRDLQLLRDTATGNFRVLVPATVPESPVAPQPMRSAILGFGVGLVIAIGLAFLLEQFDTRVRSTEDVAAILRRPLLGRIPKISHRLLNEGGVVTFAHPEGQVAEAFRMVRTNLDFMAVDGEVRSILVTSCVQGEGKSVTVANLAVAMAMAGKRVVVVDADLRRPRQHNYFGISNDKGVSTVVVGQHALRDALVPVLVFDGQSNVGGAQTPGGLDARSHLYLLPSGPIPPNPGEIVSSQRLSEIIESLKSQADVVLVDTPAMLPVGDTSALAAKVDGLLFLVDLHVVKKPQLMLAAEQLSRLPVRILGVVVRVSQADGRYYSASYRYGYSYASSGNVKRPAKRPDHAGGGPQVAPAGPAAAAASSASGGATNAAPAPVSRVAPLAPPPVPGGAGDAFASSPADSANSAGMDA